MVEEIIQTCALCKKIISKNQTVHLSRWFSPLGRKRPFHEECLRDLEDLFLEDRHAFSVIAMVVLSAIFFSFAYFVQWEKDQLGYAPVGEWIFWPATLGASVFIAVAIYLMWHGPHAVSHPHVKRWKKRLAGKDR